MGKYFSLPYYPTTHQFRCRSYLEIHLVNVTPHEFFAGSDRPHNWMIGIIEMFGRVLVLRAIATANMSARKTLTQTDPLIAGLRALFAHRDICRVNILYLVFMMTFPVSHRYILDYFRTVWAWGDSNSHVLRHTLLRRARLPVTPHAHTTKNPFR